MGNKELKELEELEGVNVTFSHLDITIDFTASNSICL